MSLAWGRWLARHEGALRAGFSRRARRTAFELWFAGLVALSLLPLFAAHYLPIQDLPQHAAAVRVLHDFADPELGFARFFERSLWSTQYLTVYLLADLLAYGFGLIPSLKLTLAAALIGLPYAARALLRALGRPESYAALLVPLAYNTAFVLGFVNFVAALPLLFLGLALAVRARLGERFAPIQLALVALFCFFTHVVPYGLLLLGAGLILAERNLGRTSRGLMPLLPSLLCAAGWLAMAPAGRALVDLAQGLGPSPTEPRFAERIAELDFWLMDVVPGVRDEFILAGVCLLGVALFALGSRGQGGPRAALARRLSVLFWLCLLGYLLLPASYDFIWPINGRFALLGLLLALVLLPRAAPVWRVNVALGCTLLSVISATTMFEAFRASERHETHELRELVAAVPSGSKVMGLIFDPSSRYLNFSPYLHAVAWVQAERGGAVMFSFADFPASPFRFREDTRLPRVPPRWEWMPQRVDTRQLAPDYDFVLTRAAPPALPGLRVVARRGAWSLLRPQPSPT